MHPSNELPNPTDIRSPAATDAPTLPPSLVPVANEETLPSPAEIHHSDTQYMGDVPLPSIPGYEILGTLGRGGMGVVYKARQLGLKRLVALKMILGGSYVGEQERSRFLLEAKAVASLRHRNIVQIHEIGAHDSLPYFSLEYCEGGSLAQKMNGTPLSATEAARMVATLAEAMQAAHEAGIIHRDLKPANVLLASGGRKSVVEAASFDTADVKAGDGEAVPKITDFGLAKEMGADSQTVSGAVMGTPSYMAPEQANGQGKDMGPSADIYALGAILYECLTGRPPFRAATALETIFQVVNTEPVPPSELLPKVPRDLETICLKCLQKDPGKRYATAADLAEDLGHFLRGEPIKARPVGRIERTWRWCRRNPVVAGLLGAVAATLVLGTVVAWLFALRAEANADRADREKTNAEASAQDAKEKAEDALVQKGIADDKAKEALIEKGNAEKEQKKAEIALTAEAESNASLKNILAQIRWNEGRLDLATDILEDVPIPLRHAGWRTLKRQFEGGLFTLYGHRGSVNCVSFSPDGKRLASASSDKTVKVWDAGSGQEILTVVGHLDEVVGVCFSPDGQRLATASKDKSVKLWDAATGKELLTLAGHKYPCTNVSFSSDGRRLASASLEAVKVWDVGPAPRGNRELLTLKGIQSACFSPDGGRLAATVGFGVVKVWDLTASPKFGQEILTFQGTTKLAVYSVHFSPDGERLATAGFGGHLQVFDARNAQELMTLSGVAAAVVQWTGYMAAFGPDGKCLASAVGTTVRLWDTPQDFQTLMGHTGAVLGVCFSPDGQRLASASQDGTVKIWNVRGRELLSFSATRARSVAPGKVTFEGYTTGLCFSPDSQRLAAGRSDGTVKVFDALAQDLAELKGHTHPVLSVCFSPDGKRLASASADKTVKLWDPATGAALLTLPYRSAPFKGDSSHKETLLFSPDGNRLALACLDKTVTLWDVSSGPNMGQQLVLEGHTNNVFSLCFSPDSQRLATAGSDSTAKVWDVSLTPKAGQLLLDLKGAYLTRRSVCFSPDGKRLATGSSIDGIIAVWDVARAPQGGKLLLEIHGHLQAITSICFSPDGQRLLTSSSDGTLKVWHAESGKELRTLRGHTDAVQVGCFSGDGERIASASEDRTVRVWDAGAGQELLILRRQNRSPFADVCFSPDGWRLAATEKSNALSLWDVSLAPADGPKSRMLKGGDRMRNICFSPDGKRLASAIHKDVKVWDTATDEQLLTLKMPSSFFANCACFFSGDGKRIICKDSTKQVQEWDAVTGTPLEPRKSSLLDGPKLFLGRVDPAVNPAGTQLALPGFGWIRLVDLGPPSREELRYRSLATRLDANWHVEEARRHLAFKNWYAAGYHLSWALQGYPDDPSHWQSLDLACRQLKSWQHAQAVCTRLATERPDLDVVPGDVAWMNFFMARAHQRMGNKARAKEYYDRARLPAQLSADDRPLFEPLPRETAMELDEGK